MKPSLLGIALAFLASGVHAAGLDCRNAQTAIERMICADADLTQLDELLMYAYEEKHSRLVTLEESSQANALERAQQEWLKTRRDRCPNPGCLKDAYRERVAALDGVTAAGVPDSAERDDFNFDGYEDFALVNGQNGPYNSYSYNVYLYSPEKRTFELSEAFSALTLDSLNFFEIDAKRKRLITSTKSGCCYHEFTEHVVRNNRPVAVFRVTEEFDGSSVTVTKMQRVGEQWRKTTKRYVCQQSNSASQTRSADACPVQAMP